MMTFCDIVLTRLNSDFFQRGITLKNKHAGQEKRKKVMGHLFFHGLYIKFQNPSMQCSKDMACTKKA